MKILTNNMAVHWGWEMNAPTDFMLDVYISTLAVGSEMSYM